MPAGSGQPARQTITLATGRFTVPAGRAAPLTLRISAAARGLLTRSRTLRAAATILTQGVQAPAQTWRATVTLLRRS